MRSLTHSNLSWSLALPEGEGHHFIPTLSRLAGRGIKGAGLLKTVARICHRNSEWQRSGLWVGKPLSAGAAPSHVSKPQAALNPVARRAIKTKIAATRAAVESIRIKII